MTEINIGSTLQYDVRQTPIFLFKSGVGRDVADIAFSTLTGSAVMAQKNVWASYTDARPNVNRASAVSIS